MQVYKIILTRLPPPKKGKYRIGNGRLFFDSKVKRALMACSVEIKIQWNSNPTLENEVHVHAVMMPKDRRADSVGILESIYDCLQESGVIKNDRQIRSGSFDTPSFGEDSAVITIRER